jgi:AraC-like DNA-binding protein
MGLSDLARFNFLSDSMTSLIKSTSLTSYPELVKELGGDSDALLQRHNIDPRMPYSDSGVIAYSALNSLLETAEEELDCPDFALQLAERQSPMILGPLAFIAQSSASVGEAIASIGKYLHIYSPAIQMELDTQSNPALPRMLFELRLPAVVRQRQTIELTLAMAHKTLQMLYGPSFRAESIWFRNTSPLSQARYQRFFKARAYFGQSCNALVMREEHLSKKIDQRNVQLHDTLIKFVSSIAAENPMSLSAQVERLIQRLLPTQRCTLPLIAERLGIYGRSLQRSLAEENLLFEDMVDGIRRELADRYLVEARMPMAQIAGLLGYAEQSSFNRACRRWHGLAPRERRDQVRQNR